MRVPSRRALSEAMAVAVVLVVLLTGAAFFLLAQVQALSQKVDRLEAQLRSPSPVLTWNESAVRPTTRHITLVVQDALIQVADNVTYHAWTFNGTVPGPVIWANQGDTIAFTLINRASMGHSIDFHAAEVDWAKDYVTIPPNATLSFEFQARYPGVFMYHCGTPPVLLHIANGMYGAIIIRPNISLPEATGGEYVLVMSEFYIKPAGDGTYEGDYQKMLAATPDYVVFNGRAFQYLEQPLSVRPNELVRLYVLNAGPSLWGAFHVIGTVFDEVYMDGNPANVQRGLQTVNLAPSNGAIIDLYFRDPGGKNPFVTHAFAYAAKGAVGLFVVQGASSPPSGQGSPPSRPGVLVSIDKGSALNRDLPGYTPSIITVVIGVNNTVTWVNYDDYPHTVTASDKSFDSGNMNKGDAWSYTFTRPGTYTYICVYHPWMRGTVIVKQP